MTDNHPATTRLSIKTTMVPPLPPHHVARGWLEETVKQGCDYHYIAAKAAQWAHEQLLEAKEADLQKARDEELDACVEWLGEQYSWATAERMRDARRRKPLSLKEQALEAHERATFGRLGDCDIIRQALEQLPD